MNKAMKAGQINSQANPINLRAALFHSTPALDRRRRTHWNSGGGAYRDSSKRFNHYSKRFRKLNEKQSLLRNVSSFAEHLFQSWQHDHDEYDPASSKGSSWFRQEYQANGSRGGWAGNKGSRSQGRRGFQFCEDDVEVETIFRSAFGGNGYFYCSFVNEEFPQWKTSSGFSNNYRTSWNWRHQNEEEYDSSTESDSSESDLASDRLALGLSASGPLKLEDVKNAYRACALKWHPDRHKGSSKAIAEEKFKVCSAAYQSLCDWLALN
uniref:J domain-containing protein n=1 Tax=Davidia involucrata TaxID=16924 RepID=A0A5B7BJ20_DAVIN